MLKMVDGTGIIGVDMICPLGVSTPQPPNYDRVELEGTGMLVLPNSLDAPLERLELGGKTEQVQTSGKNLLNSNIYVQGYLASIDTGQKISLNTEVKSFTTTMDINALQGKSISISIRTKGNSGKKYAFTDEEDVIINGKFDAGMADYSEYNNIQVPQNAKKFYFSVTYEVQENTKLQLEYGNKATSYEPYTGGKPSPSPEYPQEIKNSGKWNEETQKYEVDVKITNAEQNWSKEQVLTLTSDRPITKWDRLVEQGGEIGWLYGGKIAKDFSVKSKSTDEEVGGKIRRRFKTTLTGKFSKSNNVKCNFASTDITNSDYGIGMVGNGDVYLYFFADTKIETIEQANLLLASLPEKIIEFESESTEFVPLPQSEQNAIRALKTYYPTTVITADGGELDPDIKVTYRKEI